jgi:hypothetical protein
MPTTIRVSDDDIPTLLAFLADPNSDPTTPENGYLFSAAAGHPECLKLLLRDPRIDVRARGHLLPYERDFESRFTLELGDAPIDVMDVAILALNKECLAIMLADPRINPLRIFPFLFEMATKDHECLELLLHAYYKVDTDNMCGLICEPQMLASAANNSVASLAMLLGDSRFYMDKAVFARPHCRHQEVIESAVVGPIGSLEMVLSDPSYNRVNCSCRGAIPLALPIERLKLFLIDDRFDPTLNNSEVLRDAVRRRANLQVEALLQDGRADPSEIEKTLKTAYDWSGSRENTAKVIGLLLEDGRFDPSCNDNGLLEWTIDDKNDHAIRHLLSDSRVDPHVSKDKALKYALWTDDAVQLALILFHPRFRFDRSGWNRILFHVQEQRLVECAKVVLYCPIITARGWSHRALGKTEWVLELKIYEEERMLLKRRQIAVTGKSLSRMGLGVDIIIEVIGMGVLDIDDWSRGLWKYRRLSERDLGAFVSSFIH